MLFHHTSLCKDNHQLNYWLKKKYSTPQGCHQNLCFFVHSNTILPYWPLLIFLLTTSTKLRFIRLVHVGSARPRSLCQSAYVALPYVSYRSCRSLHVISWGDNRTIDNLIMLLKTQTINGFIQKERLRLKTLFDYKRLIKRDNWNNRVQCILNLPLVYLKSVFKCMPFEATCCIADLLNSLGENKMSIKK